MPRPNTTEPVSPVCHRDKDGEKMLGGVHKEPQRLLSGSKRADLEAERQVFSSHSRVGE